jgi:hypothetical protein
MCIIGLLIFSDFICKKNFSEYNLSVLVAMVLLIRVGEPQKAKEEFIFTCTSLNFTRI